MENTGEPGKGVIALTIEPSLPSIGKMNYSKLCIFKVDNLSIEIIRWDYD